MSYQVVQCFPHIEQGHISTRQFLLIFMLMYATHPFSSTSPCRPPLCPPSLSRGVMVDLFIDRVLVKNNKDQDELDTEREIVGRLQNRILMLFFGSATCQSCQRFAPTLADFFRRLTDESYVDRSAQLVLLYIRYSRDCRMWGWENVILWSRCTKKTCSPVMRLMGPFCIHLLVCIALHLLCTLDSHVTTVLSLIGYLCRMDTNNEQNITQIGCDIYTHSFSLNLIAAFCSCIIAKPDIVIASRLFVQRRVQHINQIRRLHFSRAAAGAARSPRQCRVFVYLARIYFFNKRQHSVIGWDDFTPSCGLCLFICQFG